MRRGCSAALFVLGGWILASVGIAGLIPSDEGIAPWAAAAIFVAVALPFLLIGSWVSPGRRLAELGLTLMISAGVAAMTLVTIGAISFDKALQRMLPEPFPVFDFTSPTAIGSILLIGGSGYLLRRWGSNRA